MRNAFKIGINFFKSFIWQQPPRIVLSMQPLQNPSRSIASNRGKSLDCKKSTQRKGLRSKASIMKQIDSNSKTVQDLDKCSMHAVNERYQDVQFQRINTQKISNKNDLKIPNEQIFINQFVFYVNPQIDHQKSKIYIQDQNKNKDVLNIQHEKQILQSVTKINKKEQQQKFSVTKSIISEINQDKSNLFLCKNNQQQQVLQTHIDNQPQNLFRPVFSFLKQKKHQKKEILHQITKTKKNKKNQIGKRILKSKHIEEYSFGTKNYLKHNIASRKKLYKKKLTNQCGICKKQIALQYEHLACTHKIHKGCKIQYMQYQMKYRCKLCQIKTAIIRN